MSLFNGDYNYGRRLRRDNRPVTECEGTDQKDGWWYQDQQTQVQKPSRRNELTIHSLLKPHAVGGVGIRAA